MNKAQELTLRDYFASCALSGMLHGDFGGWNPHHPDNTERLCQKAYEYADGMLAERAKKK